MGTGRARVGEIRKPLGARAHHVGPQPRSYEVRSAEESPARALIAASQRSGGALVIVEKLEAEREETKTTRSCLKRWARRQDADNE